MEENSYLPNCGNDDVLAVNNVMFKVSKFRDAVKSVSKNGVSHALYDHLKSLGINVGGWVEPGVDCEVLKLGAKGWQKGKIKIRVIAEFFPDQLEIEELPTSNQPEINQLESPLDDIRRVMFENNQ
jgi:post-segregation antitoxin (ccd killing protein)